MARMLNFSFRLPARLHHAPSDDKLVANAARRIALPIMGVAAALACGASTLVLAYLWWRAEHPRNGHLEPGLITVSLDPVDLVIAAVLGVVFALVCAGLAAAYFSSRAVQPLADALRRQRNFVADASHELKTPIAVLNARAQQAQIMAGNDPALRPVLSQLREDSAGLATIVDELLELASLGDAPAGRCDAHAVATDVARALEQTHPTKHVEVEVARIALGVPEAVCARLFTALVDNALSFSPDESVVRVRGQAARNMATFDVSDTGPGITGISPERIFDRFARGSRTVGASQRQRASHGIGLSLVRETAQRYGGDASVTATGSKGTTLTLTLPLADSAPEKETHET